MCVAPLNQSEYSQGVEGMFEIKSSTWYFIATNQCPICEGRFVFKLGAPKPRYNRQLAEDREK